MFQDFIEILILSAVQGISEFLPISSSAHLILVSNLYALKAGSLLIDISLHLGSLLAIIFFFRRDLFDLRNNQKLLSLIIIGSIPLIIFGYILHSTELIYSLRNIKIIAWATLFFGLVFGRKSSLTISATTFVSSMILMIAHWNWMDPSIANLQPVLNSYWLMIHVAVIVASYGPFSISMIIGIISLLLIIILNNKNRTRVKAKIQELTIVNELSITIGLIMLTIGNFLGGMWANESWGRYWGWDPKETWALISIMVYAFVIHMRLIPGLRGKWLFNLMSIIAYSSILMTYFGVNFYLVGLHSYASGDKIITPNFVYYSIIFVIILGSISRYFYKKNYS